MKRYTIDELLALMEPVYRQQKAAVEKCVVGLTVHAASLAAKGQEADVNELGRSISAMAQFWDLEASEQHITAFEEVVAVARNTGEALALTEQGKADILTGLALYAKEMRAGDPDLEEWAAECDSFAEALKEQWQAEASQAQQANQINMEMRGM